MKLRLERVVLSPRNMRCGETHYTARHPDAVVAQVREMAQAGAKIKRLARDLGIPRRTLRDWVSGSRRNIKVTKTVMRRRYE
jgi:transposase-like protein